MNPSHPHLIRVLYEWIVDNGCTPHILANAKFVGVKAPPGYTSDGQTTFNVSPSAVRCLHVDNEVVSFEGRFGGVAQSLYILALAAMVVYIRENGQGMVFDLEQSGPVDDEPDDDDGGSSDEPPRPSGRLSLKVIK